jgi:RNA polymerase sigma factor (sigma-70 family)
MEVSALTHPSVPGLRGPSALLRLQSDERLIALTRRGQHAAFETLFSRYQSRLLSFCRHMLSSREDAEDVLQEVFAAAFNAVLADERDINVRPWLYRIARNRSLNHLRRASATGVDSMDVHFADNGLSTGDRVLRRESFRELIADVHELPETQRTALLLREIDALSYDQIAHAMETTVPSVKSLLVRARISLAEAAEARKLSCDEVRLELGEAAEGLAKLTPPARRHVRSCERCRFFKRQLKDNNHALAAILPVAPLLLLKRLLLTKLGSTASAGGAHVAGGAGAGVGAGAGAGATVGAGAVAGAGAAGGSGMAGGMLTAGAGALATKAVAGLAAAAIVTAGAVAADHAVVPQHHRPPAAQSASTSAPVASYAGEPQVVREQAQPLSSTSPAALTPAAAGAAVRHRGARRHAKLGAKARIALPQTDAATAPTVAAATPAPASADQPAAPQTQPASPQAPATQVTEVTTETTQLPAAATSGTPPAQSTGTPPTTTTSTTPVPPPPAPTQPASGEPSEVSTPASGETPSPAPTEESSAQSAPASSQAQSAAGAEVSTGGTEVPTARIIHAVEHTRRLGGLRRY